MKRSGPVAALFAAFLWIASSGLALAQAPHTHRHSFGDAQKWSKIFDDPKRDAWQKPHEVIEALNLKPDAVVADIGAGTGYFAVRFARMVPKGKVYAADTEPDMVKHLAARAKDEGLGNLVALRVSSDNPQLPERADLVILVDVYHHIDAREAYFRKLKDLLRPGGRLAIIDFTLDAPQGPPRRTRVAPERVKEELSRAGYTLVEEHGFLPYQYFLVFQPTK